MGYNVGFLIEREHLIRLHELYSEPNRYYHNMNHVSMLITFLNSPYDGGGEMYDKIEGWQIIACYYHDAIYDVTKSDNEEKSFMLFHNHFYKSNLITPEEYELVKDAILGTKLYFEDVSQRYDRRVLRILDADLAPLALKRDMYIENNKNIRRENIHLTDEQFKIASVKFCENMLKKTYIYNTQFGKDMWEEKARRNLEYTLNILSKEHV